MKQIKLLILIILVIFLLGLLVGCDQQVVASDFDYDDEPVIAERVCDQFYDPEEQGVTTRCYDVASTYCFTLYEPDGDTEYYCGDEKIWEFEPDDVFDGWDFLAGAALATVVKPKTISNTKTPSSTKQATLATKNTTTVKKPTTSTKATTTVAKPTTKTTTTTVAKPKPKTTTTTVKKPTPKKKTTTVKKPKKKK